MAEKHSRWDGIIFGLLSTAVLLWPQLLNGFPIFFADTEGYLSPVDRELVAAHRAPIYNFFCSALHALIPHLWFISIVQVSIATWLLFLFCRCVLSAWKPVGTFFLSVLLAVATPIGWVAGEIMPDIFVSFAFICCFLLIFYFSRLSLQEKIALWIIFPLSTLSHLSNPSVFFGAIAMFAILQIGKFKSGEIKRIGIIALAILICFGGSQAVVYGRVAVPTATSTFLMARMMNEGLIDRSLENLCTSQPLKLCAHKRELESIDGNALLWDPKLTNLFIETGGWSDTNGEYKEIIQNSFCHSPFQNMAVSAMDTGRLFFGWNTQWDPSFTPQKKVLKLLSYLFPKDVAAFNDSFQERNLLAPTAEALRPMYHWFFIISFFGGCILALKSRSPARINEWIFLLIFTATNALICSFFSGVFERYQSRISWLITLYFVVWLISAVQKCAGRKNLVFQSLSLVTMENIIP